MFRYGVTGQSWANSVTVLVVLWNENCHHQFKEYFTVSRHVPAQNGQVQFLSLFAKS